MRRARGQAITEVTLGLIVLVPMLLTAIYLAEAAMFRLEATEAATEPLWDATAYSQQQYVGAFVQSPAAIATAEGRANARMKARTWLFTQASAPVVTCGGAPDMGFAIAGTGAAYQENGGISCSSQLTVDAKGLTRFFLDQGRGAMFKEPMANLRRNFSFCETRKCTPFKMSIGDWGMTDQGTEPAECPLTMDGCTNQGFFAKAKGTYEANRGWGTRGRSNQRFMEALINRVPIPQDYQRVKDFQMSFRGEDSSPVFQEDVPVVEGDRKWRTTPALTVRKDSYDMRTARFLGM